MPATATATNTLPVAVNSTAVAGTHSARLTLTPTNTALPRSIIVHYNVQQPTLVFAPSSLAFSITSASPPSALQQAVSVTGTGESALNWTASSSTPWIGVSPANGSSGDPLTVSLRTAQLQAPGSLFFGAAVAEQMEYSNDGWASISGSGSAGAITGAASYEFRRHAVLDASVVRPYVSARLASSRDGSRIYIASSGASTAQPVYYKDASTGQFIATSVMRNAESVASDRTGDRWVLVGVAATEVFDGSFSLLGNLPATTLAVALTSDGQRAYTYDSNGSVRAFDLTVSLPSSSSFYPEIGSSTAPADSPGSGVVMTISPDSNTLFIAGSQRVLIMPAP